MVTATEITPGRRVGSCDNPPVTYVDNLIDRALMALVTRLSGRSVAILTLLLYFGGGLALPLVLGWPVPALIGANLLGTMLAAGVSLGWLGLQIQAQDRRHLIEWTSNLRLLSAEEFEWLVGEVFRRDGWHVEETGRQDGPDGNVDLELTRDGQRRIVQCKRWTSWSVGVNDIRAFAGTLLREGLSGPYGIFVTLSDFTQQARAEAAKVGLVLIDNRDLYARVEKVRRAEPCPQCQAPMVLGRSERGWWLRCVASDCSGKRDLSGDPGRAVELLTEPPASV